MTALTDEQKQYLEGLVANQSDWHVQVFDQGEITEGWETRIHSFTARYEVNGERINEELILRLFPGVNGSRQAAKEFDVMKRVAQRGVPTPRVDFAVTEKTPLGNPFIVRSGSKVRPWPMHCSALPAGRQFAWWKRWSTLWYAFTRYPSTSFSRVDPKPQPRMSLPSYCPNSPR